MPRKCREWVAGEFGSVHLISRTAGNAIWFDRRETEYLKSLLHRFAAGFFIHIHTYCIMNNHFHILATCRDEEAEKASPQELLQRYQSIYGKNARPPEGSRDKDNILIPDEDCGIERLRRRLGSISRFVQEFKQTFSFLQLSFIGNFKVHVGTCHRFQITPSYSG